MAGPAFATPADLRKNLNLGVDALPDSRANPILDGLSGAIRDKLGWSVTEETGVVVTVDGPGLETLYLPTRRLTAVSAVTEDGLALAVNVDYLVDTAKARLHRLAGALGLPGRWTTRRLGVSATMSHGYPTTPIDEVPPIFRSVTLEYAAALLANPARMRALTVGGVTQSYADTGVGEDPRLKPYWLLTTRILLA